MATTLYFWDVTGDETLQWHDGVDLSGSSWRSYPAGTTRGAGVISVSRNSSAGPVSPLYLTVLAKWYRWVSPPLDADVTISGQITFNIRSAESAMAVNAAVNCTVEVIDGASGTVTLIHSTVRTTELGTSEAAQTWNETPAAGVACKRGDRIAFRVFWDDAAGVNMGSATDGLLIWFNGTSAGASGDTYVTLTENLSFASTPAGSTIYLTDTASDVATAAVDREAWTSRGAGVQTDVVNTPEAGGAQNDPAQFTDTAGGTVVDWWTRKLTAFTLGGAVTANIRMSNSVSGNACPRAEIHICNADGSNPVAWAMCVFEANLLITASESVATFYLAGDDVSISNGQRLRIRIYVDDGLNHMSGAGRTATLYYAGTSGGASGDSYFTFTQTLTEYIDVARVPFSSPYPQLLAH